MTIPDVAAVRDRVSAWIATSDLSKAAIAAKANVDEKTVRQAAGADWNPTVSTLAKLAAVIPPDWAPPTDTARPKRRRTGDDRARDAA